MTVRSQATLAHLWCQSWFFRANVVLAVVGILYLLTR